MESPGKWIRQGPHRDLARAPQHDRRHRRARLLGYAIGDEVPNLTQILYGVPPANSPPITVIAEPGSVYRYSGGSCEIAEALMVDTTRKSFPT